MKAILYMNVIVVSVKSPGILPADSADGPLSSGTKVRERLPAECGGVVEPVNGDDVACRGSWWRSRRLGVLRHAGDEGVANACASSGFSPRGRTTPPPARSDATAAHAVATA